jgi:hypothetical protein
MALAAGVTIAGIAGTHGAGIINAALLPDGDGFELEFNLPDDLEDFLNPENFNFEDFNFEDFKQDIEKLLEDFESPFDD